MTRSLSLTARQVTAICNGAAKAGFIAEIKIREPFVRQVPERFGRPHKIEELEEDIWL